MMQNKRLESAAHIAMGWGAGLLGLGLLLTKREMDQLPPENDRFPVMYLLPPAEKSGLWIGTTSDDRWSETHVYWSKARTLDTLSDLREYTIGYTVSYPFVLGMGVFIGNSLG